MNDLVFLSHITLEVPDLLPGWFAAGKSNSRAKTDLGRPPELERPGERHLAQNTRGNLPDGERDDWSFRV